MLGQMTCHKIHIDVTKYLYMWLNHQKHMDELFFDKIIFHRFPQIGFIFQLPYHYILKTVSHHL